MTHVTRDGEEKRKTEEKRFERRKKYPKERSIEQPVGFGICEIDWRRWSTRSCILSGVGGGLGPCSAMSNEARYTCLSTGPVSIT